MSSSPLKPSSVSPLMQVYRCTLVFVFQDAYIFRPGYPLSLLQHVSLNTHTHTHPTYYNFHYSYGCFFFSDINTPFFLWPRYRALFTMPLLIRTPYFQKTIWLKLRDSPQSRIQALSSAHTPQERTRILSSPGLRLSPSVTDTGLQGLETRKELA